MLKLDGVSTFYGKVQVLKGISLQVDKGEIVALLGPNGAGKTTVVKTISGLLKPSGGSIEFAGRRIDNLSAVDVAKLGIAHVPEGGGLFKKMTVLENVELATFGQKDKAKIANNMKSIFTRFPILEKRQGQLAGTLSGGERQMLAIARARMWNPSLYLFDEPSIGLSPLLVSQVINMIKGIRDEEGVTVLLVEQNVRMALSIAGEGYLLEVGQVVLRDKASALLNNDHVRRIYLGL